MNQKIIIEFTGKSKSTINNWSKKKPELLDVVIKGCEILLENCISPSDFLPIEDKFSKVSKKLNLKPEFIISKTGQSRQTLSNWLIHQQPLFLIILVGVKGDFNKKEFIEFVEPKEFDPLILTGEPLYKVNEFKNSKPGLYELLVKGSSILHEFKFSPKQDFKLKTPACVFKEIGCKSSDLLKITCEPRSNLNFWCKNKPLLFLSILIGAFGERLNEESFNNFFQQIIREAK